MGCWRGSVRKEILRKIIKQILQEEWKDESKWENLEKDVQSALIPIIEKYKSDFGYDSYGVIDAVQQVFDTMFAKAMREGFDFSAEELAHHNKTEFEKPQKAISDERALNFDDEDKSFWSDRFKEENGFRPNNLSDEELIEWVNNHFYLQGDEYRKK